MRKTLLTAVAAGSVATAMIAAPTKSEARCYGCWAGAAIAAGVIGSAIVANRAYGYGGYGGGYGYAPAYYGGYYGGGYAPAYYGGYYGGYAPVVRYRRVIRPAYAYYGGPRFYGPRYYGGYYRRW